MTRSARPENSRQLGIWVNSEQLDKLADIAKGEYRSLAQKVRQLIEAEIERSEAV